MRKTPQAKATCCVLLLGLTGLQLMHALYFAAAEPLLSYRLYGVTLTLIPPSFYFFSRNILFIEELKTTQWLHVCHAIPPTLALILPIAFLPPLAFTFGTIYTFWFTRVIFKLRGHTQRFKFELFFFGMFAVMALGALVLGLLLPALNPAVFYTAYANAISVALILIVAALIFFPELLSDILLVSELAYAKSRLNGIDTDTKLAELDKLMSLDKQFQNEDLSLSTLADLLELNTHQLSELINSHFGFGFPRYVREQRIKEAKRLLVTEADSSILAISMETGFKSQSSFYTAFKEIVGVSPGQFRKKSS